MNIEEIREYCVGKAGVTESFPFDEVTLVFKVGGKMFALLSLDGDNTMNLKCNPEYAVELREMHAFITPGYHMNKKHWNTVKLDDAGIHGTLITNLIDNSYDLVYNSLPKREKEKILDLL